MHDQRNDLSPAEEMDRFDAAILRILLDDDLTTPLSEHELALEMGGHLEVRDSLARLRGTGLVHRCGDFVFPTAPARRFAALL